MIRTVVVLLGAACVSGCAIYTYSVMLQNPASITIKYAPSTGQTGAMKAAADHCAQYGKSAVPTLAQPGTFGTKIQTFECR